jgi:hypothetical protein
MTLFILFNTFLEALKLHIFIKKILDSLGDVGRMHIFSQSKSGRTWKE